MSTHERIREARLRAGMSQSDLARKLDLTPQAVNMWESGTNLPRPDRVRQIARVLGVSEIHLLALDERPEDEREVATQSAEPDKRSAMQMAGELADRITAATKKNQLTRDDLIALESIVVRLLDR